VAGLVSLAPISRSYGTEALDASSNAATCACAFATFAFDAVTLALCSTYRHVSALCLGAGGYDSAKDASVMFRVVRKGDAFSSDGAGLQPPAWRCLAFLAGFDLRTFALIPGINARLAKVTFGAWETSTYV